jgi:hypothetical protein
MENSSLSRTLRVAILSALSFTIVGCASSKMTSSPQPTSAANTPTKEYEWHDMSTGKSFFGRPLQTTASQSTPPSS